MAHRLKLGTLMATSAGTFIAAACGGPTVVRPISAPTPVTARGAQASNSTVPLPSPGGVLHLQTDAGITTISLHGGRWVAVGGVATPDWSTIFTVESGRLRTLDGATGAERASQLVASGLRALVASSDGHFVALTDSPSRLGQGVLPAGRSRSTIVVAPADPAGGEIRTVTVDGNVLPEGFSSDQSRLFVIEFLPATHPDRYRVRSLDLATGQLGPVFTYDKTVDTEEMQGLSRTQAYSARGTFGPMLYTLYSRAGGVGGYDDVHALSLDGGLVHCTDLPAGFRIGPRTGAIAVSPDGRRVYVASADGAVAEIDASGSSPQPFPIAHTAQIAPRGNAHTVALTADNQTLWVALGSRLTALASTDLQPLTTTAVAQPIAALATEPSGPLYAATASAVEAIAASTGAEQVIATIETTPTRLAVS